MLIDIISYTDEQFAELNEEQLLEIQSAQLKKNALDRKLAENKLKEKHRLLDNGTFLSGIYEAYCLKLEEEHAQQVEQIRESLLFYLQFAVRADGAGMPYVVDYALSMEERVEVVRTYYLSAYTNADERFEAFKNDKIVRQYVGEYYASMYDYFRMYAEQE